MRKQIVLGIALLMGATGAIAETAALCGEDDMEAGAVMTWCCDVRDDRCCYIVWNKDNKMLGKWCDKGGEILPT